MVRKEKDDFRSKYLGRWVGDLDKEEKKKSDRIMTISTAGFSPTRDWIQKELKDTIAIVESIINKIDEKENNNMATSLTNDAMPKYEEIKDNLQVTSMTIDSSPFSSPKVKIEGYIPFFATKHNERANNKSNCPQCKGIIRRDKTTRVDWADGTRTIIVLEEGKEDMDMFHTFCIAFTKKMLGGTTKILNTIKECDTDAIEAARKKAIEEANKKAEEEAKAALEKAANDVFEAAVQQKMFEERVIEEAIRRIQLQGERKMNEEDPVESFQVVDVRAVEVEEEKTDET